MPSPNSPQAMVLGSMRRALQVEQGSAIGYCRVANPVERQLVMPSSSATVRSLVLAVFGLAVAPTFAQGQNVTAFNPYSGVGLPGGPTASYGPQAAYPIVDTVGPAGGPDLNPRQPAGPKPSAGGPPALQPRPPGGGTRAGAPAAPLVLPWARPVRRGAPPPAAGPTPPAAAPGRAVAVTTPAPNLAPAAKGATVASIPFTTQSADLSDVAKSELDRVAKNINDKSMRQVELRAYATGADPESRKIAL